MKRNFHILNDLFRPFLPSRVVMFLRHAERYRIPRPGRGAEVPLTSSGVRSAFELGAHLPTSHSLYLSHTGLRRTAQTADAIAAGFASHGGCAGTPQTVPRDAGAIIQSPRLFEVLEILGERFVPRWLEGRVDPALILPPGRTTVMLLRRAFSPWITACSSARNPLLHVHVGHDWNVVALSTVLLSRDHIARPVAYLEGVVFALDGAVTIRCLGSSAHVDPSIIKSVPFARAGSIPGCDEVAGA